MQRTDVYMTNLGGEPRRLTPLDMAIWEAQSASSVDAQRNVPDTPSMSICYGANCSRPNGWASGTGNAFFCGNTACEQSVSCGLQAIWTGLGDQCYRDQMLAEYDKHGGRFLLARALCRTSYTGETVELPCEVGRLILDAMLLYWTRVYFLEFVQRHDKRPWRRHSTNPCDALSIKELMRMDLFSVATFRECADTLLSPMLSLPDTDPLDNSTATDATQWLNETGLRRFRNLRELNLQDWRVTVPLTDATIQSLCHLTLLMLPFNDNCPQLTYRCFTGLVNLEILAIYQGRCFKNGCLVALTCLKSLTLHFEDVYSPVRDSDVAHLTQLCSLRIRSSARLITDDGLRGLVSLQVLQLTDLVTCADETGFVAVHSVPYLSDDEPVATAQVTLACLSTLRQLHRIETREDTYICRFIGSFQQVPEFADGFLGFQDEYDVD